MDTFLTDDTDIPTSNARGSDALLTMPSTEPHMRERAGYGWLVLSVTGLGVMLTNLNTSTLDVALPVVARHFHASAGQASWILLVYMLVTTVLILSFGRLADIVGRKQVYLLGLAIFTSASLGCGLAPNAASLIALRAIQAIGAAAIITNTTALLTDAFPRRLLRLGLGLNITIISCAQVIGPLVGGYLATAAGWRWVFWFNVPFGVLGLVWGALTLRAQPRSGRREPFDLVGALLSFACVASIVVFLSFGGADGWLAPRVISSLVVFVVSAPMLVIVQRRREFPLVDPNLFARARNALPFIATFIICIARFGMVVCVALYVQAAGGDSALQAGLQVFPIAVAVIIVSPIVGHLTAVKEWVLCAAGLVATCGGLLFLAFDINPHLPPIELAATLAVVGIGQALFMSPNTSVIMSNVPVTRRGAGNGVRSMMQNTGIVLGTALSLAIITAPLPDDEKAAAYAGTLSRLSRGDVAVFTHAVHAAFFVLAALCAVAIVLTLAARPTVSSAEPAG